MPIKKAENLGSLNAPLDTVLQKMNNLPKSEFRPAENTPSYAKSIEAYKRTGMFLGSYNSWDYGETRMDKFLHGARKNLRKIGGIDAGDKVHISVRPDQVGQAFDTISPLLFSEDSPIIEWKVADMERATEGHRLTVGAQFTLYMRATGKDGQYTVEELGKYRAFVNEIEGRLASAGISPGARPDSDVSADDWKFASYRNEKRSNRIGSAEQSEALRNEPVFKVLSSTPDGADAPADDLSNDELTAKLQGLEEQLQNTSLEDTATQSELQDQIGAVANELAERTAKQGGQEPGTPRDAVQNELNHMDTSTDVAAGSENQSASGTGSGAAFQYNPDPNAGAANSLVSGSAGFPAGARVVDPAHLGGEGGDTVVDPGAGHTIVDPERGGVAPPETHIII